MQFPTFIILIYEVQTYAYHFEYQIKHFYILRFLLFKKCVHVVVCGYLLVQATISYKVNGPWDVTIDKLVANLCILC